MDAKVFLKEFKTKYKGLINDKKSGLKKMLIIKPIESESEFINDLKIIGIEEDDTKKLYDSLTELLENRLKVLLVYYSLIIFSLLAWVFFTWLIINSLLYPNSLNEVDSISQYNNNRYSVGFYFLLILISAIVTIASLSIVIRAKGIPISVSDTKLLMYAISFIYFLILPHYYLHLK
jgi:hypothetical protein